MSEWTINTLKEHIEKLIEAKDNGIRSALEEREKVLVLQAAETERRLDLLNNEHERVEAATKNCVTYAALYASYSILASIVMASIAVAAIYYRN